MIEKKRRGAPPSIIFGGEIPFFFFSRKREIDAKKSGELLREGGKKEGPYLPIPTKKGRISQKKGQ